MIAPDVFTIELRVTNEKVPLFSHVIKEVTITNCGTTNPAPCCHLANDTDLLTPVLWAMAGDNKQIDLWPADPFTRIDLTKI